MPSETSVRRRARRLGYCVIKSRQRKPNIANHGYYRLIDANNNWVVLGERFDARLEDIDEFLNQKSDVLVVVPPLGPALNTSLPAGQRAHWWTAASASCPITSALMGSRPTGSFSPMDLVSIHSRAPRVRLAQ
jgi:hypothetical protein